MCILEDLKTTDRSLAAASSVTLTDVLLSPLSRRLSVVPQPAVTFTLTGSHHMVHVKQLIKAALCAEGGWNVGS